MLYIRKRNQDQEPDQEPDQDQDRGTERFVTENVRIQTAVNSVFEQT